MSKTLDFEDYKKCLLADVNENVFWKQIMFRSRRHEVHAVEVNKLA